MVDVIQDTLNTGYQAAVVEDEGKRFQGLRKHSRETIPAMMKMVEKR